jgi:hypothetical protein
MTGGRIWAKRAARASWRFPRSQNSKSSGTEAGAPRYRVGARTGLPSHPWGSLGPWVSGLELWHSKMGVGGAPKPPYGPRGMGASCWVSWRINE